MYVYFVSVAPADASNVCGTKASLDPPSLHEVNKAPETKEDLEGIDSRPTTPSHRGNFKPDWCRG